MIPTDTTDKDGCVHNRYKREQERPQLSASCFSFKTVIIFSHFPYILSLFFFS